jgi:hypothetical protein
MKKKPVVFMLLVMLLAVACVPGQVREHMVNASLQNSETIGGRFLPVSWLADKPPKTKKPTKTEKPAKTEKPSKTEKPPSQTEKPPVQTEKPPVVTDPPPPSEPPGQPPVEQPPVTTPKPPNGSPNGPVRLPPIGTEVSPPSSDRFSIEMQANGYELVQSAILKDPQGITFSIYVYFRPGIKDTIQRNSWELAFYRQDGSSQILLGTAYPSPYSAHSQVYPSSYRLVDWDQALPLPAGGLGTGNLDTKARELFHLNGLGSDVNSNGRPEFALAAQYCSDFCTQSLYALDFFEIDSHHRVVNLSQDLPGRITLERASDSPLTLRVYDVVPYDAFSQIRLAYDYVWDGTQYVDATGLDSKVHLANLQGLVNDLKMAAGGPLATNRIETGLWQVLLGFQQLDLGQQGLDTFLTLSDPANWPGSDQPTLCWLQMARAQVQLQASRDEPISLFPSRNDLFGSQSTYDLKGLILPLSKAGYDVSACQVFLKP